eukprot:g4261.t1
MAIIENCVAKFGMLLRVGFGEAGMAIVAKNIGTGNSSKFNPVIPGAKVQAIFGFCDIRNFTDCCEVLEESTMIFTNKIAKVVHRQVHKSHGSVNKNIGDAFLTVWKLKEVSDDTESSKQLVHHLTGKTNIADAALDAFVAIRKILQDDQGIQEMCADPRLQKKLPGYTVRMGYGLHLGWAIEGAIGSKYKVDASYLSPHVNMAARLESSSKQFGVQLLMSDPFFEALGEHKQEECRVLDRVTVKGSIVPITLYTHHPSETQGLAQAERQRALEIWREAYDHYHDGKWALARQKIHEYEQILPEDQPAQVLLRVMEEQSGGRQEENAPESWLGFRALTSK